MNNSKNKKRVVVTGLGAVTSIGIGWQEFWNSLLAGKCGISKVEYFDTDKYQRCVGGQIKNFNAEAFISKRQLDFLGRASQMAIAATQLAVDDSGIKAGVLKKSGVFLGTTMGEGQEIEFFVERRISAKELAKGNSTALKYPANSVSTNVAHFFNLHGRNAVFGNACAAGNFSIGFGADCIQKGDLDCMVVGGCDPLSRIAYTGFHRMITIAPEKCQPFDKNRQGMIPGEGAGILILEEYEHAKKRGAKIYAEILGYGIAADAYHMTQPHFRGSHQAVSQALKNAEISPDQVDYISAHGTGTEENDRTECAVFHEVFGKALKNIPVSSIKSMLGHTMGAASALEAIACCLAIKEDKVPPTINFETPDPECDIDCVPNKFRKHKVKIALNNSLAFGGNDFSVFLGKEEA